MTTRAFPEDSIGYYRGPLQRLLVAIDRAGLDGAVLTVDGECEELQAFAEQRTRSHPELSEANRKVRGRRGFLGIRYGVGPYHLPIEGSNLGDLATMLEHHADPEIAGEVQVFRGEETLVFAPDAGDNEIWVSTGFPASARGALMAGLGGGLTQESS